MEEGDGWLAYVEKWKIKYEVVEVEENCGRKEAKCCGEEGDGGLKKIRRNDMKSSI